MLPDSGSILRGVHFWEVSFALMLSPGWFGPAKIGAANRIPALIESTNGPFEYFGPI
jgi:hypothetical protein